MHHSQPAFHSVEVVWCVAPMEDSHGDPSQEDCIDPNTLSHRAAHGPRRATRTPRDSETPQSSVSSQNNNISLNKYCRPTPRRSDSARRWRQVRSLVERTHFRSSPPTHLGATTDTDTVAAPRTTGVFTIENSVVYHDARESTFIMHEGVCGGHMRTTGHAHHLLVPLMNERLSARVWGVFGSWLIMESAHGRREEMEWREACVARADKRTE